MSHPSTGPSGLRGAGLVAWLCALAALLAAAVTLTPSTRATAAPAAAPPAVQGVESIPFKAQSDYYCTRIPALVTTREGVLLAFAEGRNRPARNCADVGENDLILKRSTDGGATWSALTVVVGAGDQLAHGNPAPVVDAVTGRISLLYASSDWNRDSANPSRAGLPRTIHVTHSLDGGLTWSAGRPLPQRKAPGWGWVSTGPGHGIQLSRGPQHGRLVVPGDHTSDNDSKGGAHLNYSDDGG
ncbi:sialidase family protein [Streptomyces sp. NPDC097619]|uniref:sialidase family protein n=1 Tax=Streptomyces sp. NPDC097619 TaxID=3157228 RepID=UPI00332A53D0